MSDWVQVDGVIRILDIRNSITEEEIYDMFGKPYTWEDAWGGKPRPKKVLPEGSEGSLNMYINIERPSSYIAPVTLTITGSLRDEEGPTVIEKWLDEIYANKNVCNLIEHGFINVICENSYGEDKDYTYYLGNKERRLIHVGVHEY